MYTHKAPALDGWLTDAANFVGDAVKKQFTQGSAVAPIAEPSEPSFLQRYGLLLAAGAAAGLLVLSSRK